jgi:hypothetical protein
MGGYGSGRNTGTPTADASLRIDLAWMMRTGKAKAGCHIRGTLHWTCRGEPAGSISYTARMDEPGNERLELSYSRGEDEKRESVSQTIHLCHTNPHYGGQRWWMICPYQGIRVGKIYKPGGGDCFASRKSWGLAYHIQHVAHRDRAFERLFKLQKTLGGDQGVDAGLRRPKGMWQRTYDRHLARYWELDAQCNVEMVAMIGRLGG